MKNLVKLGIFAFAFGLFATACNSANNQNNGTQDSLPAVEQEAPAAAPATTPDSLSAPMPDTTADTNNM